MEKQLNLHDAKLLQDIVPKIQEKYMSNSWTREQAQLACSKVYSEMTSEKGQEVILNIHDGLEEKHAVSNH